MKGGRLLGMGMVSQVQDSRKNQKDKNLTTNQMRKGGDIGKGFGKQCQDFTDPSSQKMINGFKKKIFCAVYIWIF